MVFVAVAGPVSNLIAAIAAGLLFRFTESFYSNGMALQYLGAQLLFVAYFGIGLSFFNLLPVPPLDGSNIVMGVLPQRFNIRYINAMRYAPAVFLVLIVLEWSPLHIPLFSTIIDPLWKPYNALWQVLIFGRKDFLHAFF
jgi:Zn-dependent protease